MKFALVEGERREAKHGLSGKCPLYGQNAESTESTIGRIGLTLPATIGGNLKQNGTALGKTSFPQSGRRLSNGQRMAKSTSPT
jgi:hypothetical protein